MKNRIIASLAALMAAFGVMACFYELYTPVEYLTSRIPGELSFDEVDMIKLWQRDLLKGFSDDEVRKVIFHDGYTVEDLRAGNVSRQLADRFRRKDGKELLDYILVMRMVENQRNMVRDPWFYYYPGNPRLADLDSLADVCIGRLDTPLGDRYAVQACRALRTLGRYEDIDSIARVHKFKDKDMELIFRPLYASVLYRTGKYDEALKTYVECGDRASVVWCMKKLGRYADHLSVAEALSESEDNYNEVCWFVNDFIRSIECRGGAGSDKENPLTIEVGRLIEISHAKSKKAGKYQNMWRYAEAMGHLLNRGDYNKADSVLNEINTATMDKDFARSVRALRFIVESKIRPYDENYFNWLASEAQWLISQGDIEMNKMRQERKEFYERISADDYDWENESDWLSEPFDDDMTIYNRNMHVSSIYFSDMLHKGVDCNVVPRMLEHGDTISALQMLDVVDYCNMTKSEIVSQDNHASSSVCFAMEIGADNVVNALNGGGKQHSAIRNLWKRNGSSCHTDRWYDLAGTALLGEGRYAEAVKMLERVTPDYAKQFSGERYDAFKNPFSPSFLSDALCHEEKTQFDYKDNYKLWFAREMARLSKQDDPESRLLYAIGMHNSVFPCWALTAYGCGSPLYYIGDLSVSASDRSNMRVTEISHEINSTGYWFDDLPYEARLQNADLRRQAIGLVQKAIAEMPDKNKAAEYLREMGFYRTIKYHYIGTDVAQEMFRTCDRWKDW